VIAMLAVLVRIVMVLLVVRFVLRFVASVIQGRCLMRSAYAARRFSTSASIFAFDCGGKYFAT